MKELIKACQQCDPAAQKLLYERHVDRLYYTIFRYVKNQFDVENLLQDVFLKIYNNIFSFDKSKGSFITWSATIAIRTALNHCKKAKFDFSFIEDHLALENEIIVLPLQNLAAQDLLNLINSIEDKYRVIFNLYEIDGYKHDEIAKMLNIKASTSRSSLTRAKKLIIEKIAQSKLMHYG